MSRYGDASAVRTDTKALLGEIAGDARELHRNPEGRPHSLRIAAELAQRGFATPSGLHYSASAFSSMLRA